MEEEDHVAVLDNVVAPFGARFASFAGAYASFVADHVVVGDDFGADKPFFDVGVDFAGSLGGGGPFLDGPGAGFDFTGGDVVDEAEEREGFAGEAVEARFGEAEGGEELAGIGFVEAGDLLFDLGADGDDAGALFGGVFADDLDVRIVEGGDVVFTDVADVEHFFAGEEVVLGGDGLFFGSEFEGAEGEVLVEVLHGFFKEVDRGLELFAGFGLLFDFGEGVFGHLKVGEDELKGDHFDVVEGIDSACDVDDVGIFKAADDLDNGVGVADVREELVAEPFSLGGAFDKTCDVDETDGGRDDLFALGLVGEDLEAGVGEVDNADVRVDGAKGVVFRGDLFACDCVEEGRFADVGEAHKAAWGVAHSFRPNNCCARVRLPAASACRIREEEMGSPWRVVLGRYSTWMSRGLA